MSTPNENEMALQVVKTDLNLTLEISAVYTVAGILASPVDSPVMSRPIRSRRYCCSRAL